MPWINGVFVPENSSNPTQDYSGLPQGGRGVTSAITPGAPNVGDRVGYYDRKGMYLGPLYDPTGNKLPMPKGATGIHGTAALPQQVGDAGFPKAVQEAQGMVTRPDLQAAYNLGFSGTPPAGTSPFARSYALGYGGREAGGVSLPPLPDVPAAGAFARWAGGNLMGAARGTVNLASLAYNRLFGGQTAFGTPAIPRRPQQRPNYATNY